MASVCLMSREGYPFRDQAGCGPELGRAVFLVPVGLATASLSCRGRPPTDEGMLGHEPGPRTQGSREEPGVWPQPGGSKPCPLNTH